MFRVVVVNFSTSDCSRTPVALVKSSRIRPCPLRMLRRGPTNNDDKTEIYNEKKIT